MVVGRFPRCVGLNQNDSLYMLLKDALQGYKFPVITEFDMGHTDPMHTIPIGAKAEIVGTKLKVKIVEPVVR
jgi:muramoyltetrapeptide carboxypeptidase